MTFGKGSALAPGIHAPARTGRGWGGALRTSHCRLDARNRRGRLLQLWGRGVRDQVPAGRVLVGVPVQAAGGFHSGSSHGTALGPFISSLWGDSEPGLPKATRPFAVYILKVICDQLCDPISTGPSRPQANKKENLDYFTLMGDRICKSEKKLHNR